MASLYRRSGSPFWWLKYQVAGRWRYESTGLRHAVVIETRKARERLREVREGEHERTGEEWETWVPRFLDQRYGTESKTALRYMGAWHNIAAFLRARRITIPRQLNRQAVRDYLGWRAMPHEGVYAGCRNTALHELRLLGMIMREAIQSGFASVNPCEKLGIQRDASRRKPRITEQEYNTIMAALAREPEWMAICFAICWFQGCRVSESHLHLATQLDIARGIIRFRTKGKKDTLAEFPLAAQLVPMFQRLLAEHKEYSYEAPASMGKAWYRFFRRIGMPHLCVHCCRVTAITRMYEAGIPKDMVMRLVGHSSHVVHEVYPRLAADHAQVVAMRRLLDAQP